MNKASRLALLLELIITEATTIKDTDAVAFKLKLHFNSLFKEARRYSREYDKACARANVSDITENATSDLYDCFDIIMSTDIIECKKILEKFRDENNKTMA